MRASIGAYDTAEEVPAIVEAPGLTLQSFLGVVNNYKRKILNTSQPTLSWVYNMGQEGLCTRRVLVTSQLVV